MKMPPTPDLDQSIQKIKAAGRDLAQNSSPKHIAAVYVAAIGLMYHLKRDQAHLQRIRYVRIAYLYFPYYTKMYFLTTVSGNSVSYFELANLEQVLIFNVFVSRS